MLHCDVDVALVVVCLWTVELGGENSLFVDDVSVLKHTLRVSIFCQLFQIAHLNMLSFWTHYPNSSVMRILSL